MAPETSQQIVTRDFKADDAEDVHEMIQELADARGRFESHLVLRGDFAGHFPAYVNAVTKGGAGTVRIAEIDDELAGVAIAVESQRDPWLPAQRSAELRAIYVAPDHRKAGVATSLIEDIASWARDRGLDNVSVHTFADHPEEAEALKAVGFQEYRVQLELPLDG